MSADSVRTRTVSCPLCGKVIDEHSHNFAVPADPDAGYFAYGLARDAVDDHREETGCPLASTADLRFGEWKS